MNALSLTIEQQKFVEDNLMLVHHFLKTLNISYDEYEDLAQYGTIGLCNAVLTFDKSKNMRFSTYAYVCIRNAVLVALRNVMRETKHSIDKEYYETAGNSFNNLEERVFQDEDFSIKLSDENEFEYRVNIILNCLKPLERKVMLYYISGMRNVDIGKKENITESYACRIIKRSAQKILAKEGDTFQKDISFKIDSNYYLFKFSNNLISKISVEKIINSTKVKAYKSRDDIILRMPSDQESFYLIASIL